jgi:hypothetical protein
MILIDLTGGGGSLYWASEFKLGRIGVTCETKAS